MLNIKRAIALGAYLIITAYSLPTNRNATITSYPMPIQCTGESCTEWNASLQDFNIIRHQNGTFFRMSNDNGQGKGMVLSTAPSLQGPWKLQQPVLGPQTALAGIAYVETRNATSLWGPDLHYINGLYYCYYSVYDTALYPGFDIRVATSPTMDDNTWIDHGSIGVPQSTSSPIAYSTIDSNLLTDYDTGPYGEYSTPQIVWGSFVAGLYGMNMAAGNPLLVDPTSPIVEMIQDQKTLTVPGSGFGYNRTEGSYHTHINGLYYYFYSRGSCCSDEEKYAYVTEVCRSTLAAGPYLDRKGKKCAGKANGQRNGSGTVLLASHAVDSYGNYQVMSPGSVGILKTKQGPVLTYQYVNQSNYHSDVPYALNYGHNWLAFDNEGWPYVSETPQQI